MKNLNKKGFTIVELVIVIAVIAILAAVLIPTFSGVVSKANYSSALQKAHNALTLALQDQKDGALDDKTYVVVDNEYSFIYSNNTISQVTTSSTTVDTYYFNSSYVTGAVVYILATDQAQLDTSATGYSDSASAVTLPVAN